MAVLAIDLGGTKLALAAFADDGMLLYRQVVPLAHRQGAEVGQLITDQIHQCINANPQIPIQAIGICVPGISRVGTGTVWAPNIAGWDDYPLLHQIKEAVGDLPVTIDSDRACYMLGEWWQGTAQGCQNAIFLAVGTGIGAGILVHGTILRGANDIAGAIGWMALQKPYQQKFESCGCFEYHASGAGMVKVVKELLEQEKGYTGELSGIPFDSLTAADVFAAYEKQDVIAVQVIEQCIEFWGMAIANLVSLFNPEKIILGGGVFGPARHLIGAIVSEAEKWAQPIAIRQVQVEGAALGSDAGLYGAGKLALQQLIPA